MVKTKRITERKKHRKLRWAQILPFYLMALPGIFYLLINNYIPMFGVLLAFKNFNVRKGILGSDWVGLENFRFLFLTKDALSAMRNTILYNLTFILLGTIVAVGIAVLLNEIQSKRSKKIYQTVILLPYVISWVVVGYLAYAFLAPDTGFVNNSILEPLGQQPVSWYQDRTYWPFILVFFHIWKGVGYTSIIYYSSIVSISSDYYEAARIDGASKWQQIKRITLPLLIPTIITTFILSVGGIFRSDFGLFYQVPQRSGILMPVTRTIDVYVYQALMKEANFGMSGAASAFQSVVCFVCIVVANLIVKKFNKDSALF